METKLEQPLVWKPDFSTGVAIIDDQHRVLINMLNEASSKLTDRSPLEDFSTIVQGLLNYAGYHFGTEERLVSERGYDKEMAEDAALHIDQHRDFAGKVMAAHAKLSAGQRIPKAELVGFLRDWLVNHIMNTDKKLGSFICSKTA
jgi:hemerythrin